MGGEPMRVWGVEFAGRWGDTPERNLSWIKERKVDVCVLWHVSMVVGLRMLGRRVKNLV